jgi:hypothetical protein
VYPATTPALNRMLTEHPAGTLRRRQVLDGVGYDPASDQELDKRTAYGWLRHHTGPFPGRIRFCKVGLAFPARGWGVVANNRLVKRSKASTSLGGFSFLLSCTVDRCCPFQSLLTVRFFIASCPTWFDLLSRLLHSLFPLPCPVSPPPPQIYCDEMAAQQIISKSERTGTTCLEMSA